MATLELAWVKWYSTLVPTGSGSIQEATPADLADWRFDGNTDEAATGVVATIQGTAKRMAPKPVYPPVCMAGPPQRCVPGTPLNWMVPRLYALDGGLTLTYSWQQVSALAGGEYGPGRVRRPQPSVVWCPAAIRFSSVRHG